MSKVELELVFESKTGVHVWSKEVKAAKALLDVAGWDLAVDQRPKTMIAAKFKTRRQKFRGTFTPWDEWDAELGKADLAFMIAMVLDLPFDAEGR